MKRELPFLSPISLLIAALIFAGLGFSLWKNGGEGFNPGPVSAQARAGTLLQQFSSHADFEKECKRCHQPLETGQASLCTSCHESVAVQRIARTGTHGRIDPALRCAECHPEHKGRNFDMVAYAVSQFDHNQTDMPLTGAHAALDCDTCHKDDGHQSGDIQSGDNQNGVYQLTYQGCNGCHAEPQLHEGLYSLDCQECHTDLYWKPAMIAGRPFDHSQNSFTLVRHTGLGAGKEVLCADCHAPGGGKTDLQACANCHAQIDANFMQGHQKTMGSDCVQCHDGNDRMAGFKHEAVFPLDGKHANLDCAACHQDFHFRGTADACSGCHQEAEIHAGYFGSQCQYCHTSQAWRPAKLIKHTFALDHGGQGEIACQSCHPDSYASYTCYTCHEHTQEETSKQHAELKVAAEALANCAACHPTGRSGEAENRQPAGGEQ